MSSGAATVTPGPVALAPTGDALLDQALWRRLNDTSDAAFYDAWLALLCRAQEGVRHGALFAAVDGAVTRIADWNLPETGATALVTAARTALEGSEPVIRMARGRAGGAEVCALAVVVSGEGAEAGATRLVATLSQSLEGGRDPRRTIRAVEWGGAWLRERMSKEAVLRATTGNERAELALRMIASGIAQERFDGAAQALVTTLTRELRCDRAALGIRKDTRTQLAALSNNAEFAKRMNLARGLTGAMDEAIDQDTALRLPQTESDDALLSTRLHRQLTETGGAKSVLTVPLRAENEVFGALTLERVEGTPFADDTVELVDAVGAVMAPLLRDKKLADRWIGARVADDVRSYLRSLFGPRHYLRKAVGALLALAAVFLLLPATYVADAPASIEGRITRVVAAPIDGYVAAARARAGDVVSQGQTLAVLDDRDLALELEGWRTVMRQRDREYDRALAQGDPAAASIIRAQIEQAAAQTDLVQAQLDRTRLAAPIDGVVVSGDLDQRIGGAVRRGEGLFEVAPLDGYRVTLRVAEADLSDVTPGQRGRLLLSTFPGRPIDFEVVRVTPVAEVLDGRNVFLAEADLGQTALRLRPGMEGLAKIEIDRRPRVVVWTRDLIGYLRLQAWRFWG